LFSPVLVDSAYIAAGVVSICSATVRLHAAVHGGHATTAYRLRFVPVMPGDYRFCRSHSPLLGCWLGLFWLFLPAVSLRFDTYVGIFACAGDSPPCACIRSCLPFRTTWMVLPLV